jgi:hypothetical protein
MNVVTVLSKVLKCEFQKTYGRVSHTDEYVDFREVRHIRFYFTKNVKFRILESIYKDIHINYPRKRAKPRG